MFGHAVQALKKNLKLRGGVRSRANTLRVDERTHQFEISHSGLQATIALALAVFSVFAISAGLLLTDGKIDWPGAVMLAGAIASVVAAGITLTASRENKGAENAQLEYQGRKLDSRLEQLKDAQWELSENEVRYRDLLDTQVELISRRDEHDRYVFVNKAFCRAFDIVPQQVIGNTYSPHVLERREVPPQFPEHDQRISYEELVKTHRGPRWIAWEEQLVLSSLSGGYEVQSIGRDVTAEREAEAMLMEARDQAEGANRAKSRFLAAMSHEIRTPMNGILGMTGLLAGTPQNDEQQTYLTAIDKSARALLALIDEILDFSKIEAGKMELNNAPFALRSCVMGAVDLLSPRAREKGLDLECSFASDLDEIYSGDEFRVRQIVLNLVSNAIKFTDNGHVRIGVSPMAKVAQQGKANIAIAVEDTGIGLAASDMKKLFDEFEQAESVISRGQGGTGLGLAISRRLARAMGGDLFAEGALGRGAKFTALLGLDPAVETGLIVTPGSRSLVQSEEGVALNGEKCRIDGSVLPRVLIAEDNEINALLARRVVEMAGCEALVVGTGFAAVSAVKDALGLSSRPIDLILMDVFMPGLDGIEASREIRRMFQQLDECRVTSAKDRRPEAHLKRPPIIALTANAFVEDRQRCLAAGMDDYLAKPFDAADLKLLLDRWVKKDDPEMRARPGGLVPERARETG